jgi:hypothetical protein
VGEHSGGGGTAQGRRPQRPPFHLIGPSALDTIRQIFATSPAVAPSSGYAPRCRSASADTLYFVDRNSIDLCNLLPRHPVARQGADPTVLGSGYLAGLTPDRRPSRHLLLIGGCFDFRRIRRHLRRDGEDTWLAPRLLLSWRRGIRGGCRHVRTYGLLTRLKQIFSVLASSVDPLTIIKSVRRLPFG